MMDVEKLKLCENHEKQEGKYERKKKKEKKGKEKKEKQRKKCIEQFFLTYFQIYVSTFLFIQLIKI